MSDQGFLKLKKYSKSSQKTIEALSDKDRAFLEIYELHQLDFSKLTPEEQTAAEDRAFELALIVTA